MIKFSLFHQMSRGDSPTILNNHSLHILDFRLQQQKEILLQENLFVSDLPFLRVVLLEKRGQDLVAFFLALKGIIAFSNQGGVSG